MKRISIQKILEVNKKIFPYLVFLSYFFLFIEAYTYQGFLFKSLLINARVFAALTALSAIGVIRKNRDLNGQFFEDLIFYLNSLLLPVFTSFYFIMQASESKHYSNYVYSTFHLQPDQFSLLVFFSAGITLIGVFRKLIWFDKYGVSIGSNEKRYSYKFIRKNALYIVIVAAMGYTLFSNAFMAFKNMLKSDLYIATNLNTNYDQKMEKSWGFYYNYMKFVNDHIIPGSIVLIPPQQGPWLSTGNAGLDRYFLYPSWTINGNLDSSNNVERYDYVLIAYGEWLVTDNTLYNWPKFTVKAEKIWYYDPQAKDITTVDNEIYNPDDKINDGAWGLIKVKND